MKWFPSHFCGTFFLFSLPLRKDSRCAVICVKGSTKTESTILKKEASNAKPPNMYRKPKIIRFKCFWSDFLKIKRMFISLLGLYLGRECCWWGFQFFNSHQSIQEDTCFCLHYLRTLWRRKISSALHMNSTFSYVSGFLFVFQRNTEYEPDSHRRRTSTFCFRHLNNSIPLRKQGIRQIPKRNTRLFQAVVSWGVFLGTKHDLWRLGEFASPQMT